MSGRFTVSCLCNKGTYGNAGRIGFIVDGLLPSWSACIRRRTVRPLLTGWPSNTAGAVMRFGWVSQHVNRMPDRQRIYELYRPWRSYKAVIFIKSMDAPCRELAATLKQNGVYTVFDANVDYFTPAWGTSYYSGMAPTPKQRAESCAMATTCNGVIADSRYLLEKVLPYNRNVVWIPDNVLDVWVANKSTWRPSPGERLILLWSGEAVKLFELLRIEEVLRRFGDYIHLRLVTGSLDALSQIHEPWQGRLRRLLTDLECEVLPFKDIPSLLALYDQGGVCISPRFLDNSYNMGHTEWKISLAMARGRVALASPQPSYCDLQDRAEGLGVHICAEDVEWDAVLDSILTGNFSWEEEQGQACAVVRQYYATSVVAEAFVKWLDSLVTAR
jgi:hypothetical protein